MQFCEKREYHFDSSTTARVEYHRKILGSAYEFRVSFPICLYEKHSIIQITISEEPHGCMKWRAVKSKVDKIMTEQLSNYIYFCVVLDFFLNIQSLFNW